MTALVGRLAALDRALVAPGTSHRCAWVRTGLALTIALRLGTRDWRSMAGQPVELFHPVGALAWVPHMPGPGVLVALQLAGLVGAAVALVGRRRAAGLAVAWLALLALAGLRTSAGKILHNDVLLLLAAAPMLLAPGDALRGVRARSTRWGWPVRAALVVVALVYLLSGLQKLRHSGLAWVTSDNMRWILYSAAAGDRPPTASVATYVADRAWMSHAAASSILGLELLAPALLGWRRSRVGFAILAAGLHAGTWLMLGLDYWGWILTVAVLALPWDALPWLPAERAGALEAPRVTAR